MSYHTVLIIGFTKRTSYHAAKFLLSRGIKVLISDSRRDAEKEALLNELKTSGDLTDLLGVQDVNILNLYHPDLLLPSPGVPLNIPLIVEGKARGIPLMGDIELFYESFPDASYAAITGTDGKTTTTTLLHAIVSTEKKAFLGGNVGIPIFEHAAHVDKNSAMILELSSYQLEAVKNFRPKTAAVLNIAEDHLDRYESVQSYMLAKKNIFKNQTKDDFAVLNADSPYFNDLKEGIKPKILTFSRRNEISDIYFKDGIIYLEGKKFIDRHEIKLQGVHNVENAMAAILMAKTLDITDHSIKNILAEFAGLPHRLEFLRLLNGVEYYNDSKSTTVNSLEKALESFNRPVILIAGGRDKGLDFKPLKKLAGEKLKELVLIGEAAEKIKTEIGFEMVYTAKDMKDAVQHSRNSARNGDIVLLSPGCASFDMFKNYEERGDAFKKNVAGLN